MRAWKSSSRKVWPMAGTVVLAVTPGERAEVVVLPSVDLREFIFREFCGFYFYFLGISPTTMGNGCV